MAENRIVMTDTQNTLLPLAWGVAGGTVKTYDIQVDKQVGTNNAGSMSINNSNIVANSGITNTAYTFTASNNGSFIVNANTVSITGINSLSMGSANAVAFSSGNTMSFNATNNLALSGPTSMGGANFTASYGSMEFSTGNFVVQGPAVFCAPTTFKSPIYLPPIMYGTTNDSSSMYFYTSNNGADTGILQMYYKFNVFGDIMIAGTSGTYNGANYSYGNFNVHTPVMMTNTVSVYGSTTFYSFATFNAYTYFNYNANMSVKSQYATFEHNGFRSNFASNDANAVNYSSASNRSSALFESSVYFRPTHFSVAPSSSVIIDNGVVNTDTSVFTNLQCFTFTPNYSFNNSATSVTIPYGNFTQIMTIPITQSIDTTTFDDNAALKISLYHTEATPPAIDYDESEYGALYIDIYDSVNDVASECYLIDDNFIIQQRENGNNKRGLIKLKKLLSTFINNNTPITTLTSNCSFRLFGQPYSITLTNRDLTGIVEFYDAVTAGSGGGGVDNTNLYVPYSDSSTYAVGDIVYYNTYIYRCITAVTTAETFDPNKWVQTSVTAELSYIRKYINSLENLTNVQF